MLVERVVGRNCRTWSSISVLHKDGEVIHGFSFACFYLPVSLPHCSSHESRCLFRREFGPVVKCPCLCVWVEFQAPALDSDFLQCYPNLAAHHNPLWRIPRNPKQPQQPGLGQARARRWELHLWLPCGWQGPKHVCHHALHLLCHLLATCAAFLTPHHFPDLFLEIISALTYLSWLLLGILLCDHIRISFLCDGPWRSLFCLYQK